MEVNNLTGPTDFLTAALIGCGRMGARTSHRVRQTAPKGWLPLSHAEAIRANPDLKLVALCDINEENLSWASANYGVDQCYTDFKSLILAVRPHILAIATRTPGRCEILKFAAENGVQGVHLEKPLSQNMADCKRALEAVAQNGVKITYGTIRRFMDVYRKAKDLIKSGVIGEIVEIAIDHGRTLLMWNHPHSVDLLLFYNDSLQIRYVQAACTLNPAAVRENLVDDDPIIENALVKFQNGVNGIITSAGGLNTRISGTTGNLTVAADGSWIELRKKTSQFSPYFLQLERLEVLPQMSATQRAFAELAEAVRQNRASSVRPEEIAVSQNILFSFVLSSLRGGIRLSLPELPDNFTVTGKYNSLYA